MRFDSRHMVIIAAITTTIGLVAACGSTSGPTASEPAGAAAEELHHTGATAPPPQPLRAGERFQQISMAQPYKPVPPAGGTDEYRCFLIDPHLTKKTFITGSQFLPVNGDIVHHAIMYRVQPGDVQRAKDVDARDEGDGWTCFGGPGVGSGGQAFGSDQAWVGAWAPGGHETLLGTDLGYAMEPGAQIVMQIHYNLLATDGTPGPLDQSALRLRLNDSAAIRPLRTTLLPAPIELPCAPQESGPLCDREQAVADVAVRFGLPARVMVNGLNYTCSRNVEPKPGPTQHCDIKVRQAGVLYSVAGHMHLLGRSIKVELNPGTPKAQTLLDVPAFDFDDQSARPLAKPVTVKPGDTYRVTCTHDATLRARLPELQKLKPRYVVWGDGTSDEMCLGIVVWAAP